MKRNFDLSSTSTPSSESNFKNDTLYNNAKSKFLNRVSDGISYLVHRHGYSQSRATDLILNELRKSDPLPSDDEVFEVMQKHQLGMTDATKVIIISKALSKQIKQNGYGMEPSKAVDSLTSNLTTMKLLGKVESQGLGLHTQILKEKDELQPQQPPTQSTTYAASATFSDASSTNASSNTDSWQIIPRTDEKSNKNNSSIDESVSSPSQSPSPSPTPTDQNQKKKPNKSTKTPKKTKQSTSSNSSPNKKNESSSSSSSDVDAAVAKKVILQKTDNSNPSSSSTTTTSATTMANTRKRTASPRISREKCDLDSIVRQQPPAKRQRLDSI